MMCEKLNRKSTAAPPRWSRPTTTTATRGASPWWALGSLLHLVVAVGITILPPSYAQLGPTLFTCNFDGNNICDMVQSQSEDDFDWKVWSGRTPTGAIHVNDNQMTGPSRGQGNSLYYIYLETSQPRLPGEIAKIWTPPLNYNGAICVGFYYHMLGAAVGNLTIHVVPPGSRVAGRAIWINTQSMLDQWFRVTVDTSIQPGSRIEFRGSVGGHRNPDVIWSGDIAYDTIAITQGSCSGGVPPTLSPPTTTDSPQPPTFAPTGSPPTSAPTGNEVVLPFACDFETSLCGLTGINAPNVFSWTRFSGATPTIGTGPNRAFSGSWFIYVETSEPRQVNDRYIVQTLPILYQGDACMSFAYHMNGPHVNRFLIYSTPTSQVIFDVSGSQGPDWRQASVDVRINYQDRIIFEVTRGSDIRGDVGIDNLRIDPAPCSSPTPGPTPQPTAFPTPVPTRPTGVRPLPWSCGFERDFCGMQQSAQDRFDWTRIVLTTPTVGTGPPSARSGQYYIFTEASDPRVPGDTAIISTPMFDTTGPVCIQFFYHMYGSGMGSLVVYNNRFGRDFRVFERRGNQGNEWKFERVTFNNFNFGDQVTFEVVRGQSYTSDVALDDISIGAGACDGGGTVPTPAPPTPRPPTPAPPSTGERFSCDVEDTQGNAVNCRLRQDQREDQIDWTRVSGKTPSGALYSRRTPNGLFPVTGPDGARQGGFYLYIEASGRPRNLMARIFIEGSDVQRGGTACLRFYYSMNGYHMGNMRVFTRIGGGQRTTRWSLSGDQGNGWQSAAVDLNLNGASEVGIEGTTKGEFSGDISIDDIRVIPGQCESTPSQYIYLCNFETGSGSATICGMTQDRNDRFDWSLGKGSTPSQVTGPDRAFSGQYYMFIEASRPRVRGDFAVLLTPEVQWNGDMCLQFAYHMYGFHIGTLDVFVRDVFSNSDQTVWSESGQKSNQWQQARVTFSNFRSGSRIGFRGIRGGEYSGDIGIDSLMLQRNRC